VSTKNLLSLIYGDKLRVAPKTKIIPSDDLSQLIDAFEVMRVVKEDAEKYRHTVAKECEHLKEQAFKEGYEEGYKEWTEHLADFETKLEELRREFQKIILPVALKAAKKIVGREIELDETTIVDIVASTLKAVAQHKKITIFVNKKDLDVLESHKPRLRELFEHLESLSIRARDDISQGGCMIETEVGIINAQMEHRWKVLEKAFESLVKISKDTIIGSE
jgi:type III secretion protein L